MALCVRQLRPSPDSPQAYLGNLRHGDEAEDNETEADTFPVLAHDLPVKLHDLPVKICIPVRSAGGGRYGPRPLKSIEASLSRFFDES